LKVTAKAKTSVVVAVVVLELHCRQQAREEGEARHRRQSDRRVRLSNQLPQLGEWLQRRADAG
jgi:hypothetical protein